MQSFGLIGQQLRDEWRERLRVRWIRLHITWSGKKRKKKDMHSAKKMTTCFRWGFEGVVNRRNRALVFCWIFEKGAQRRSANYICYDALVSSQAFRPFLYAISLLFFYIITLSQPILTMLQGLVSTHTGNDRDGIPFQEEWRGSPNLAADLWH